MYQVLMPSIQTPCVWDRDRYSNLRFYYVHHIMYLFRHEVIGMSNEWTVRIFEKLNALALNTGLQSQLSYLETLHPSPPTLILLNSNLVRVGQTLFKRGGANDVYNAKENNYQAAQHYVYLWFAKLLNHCTIDLSFAYDVLKLNVPNAHDEIIKRLMYRDENGVTTETPNVPITTDSNYDSNAIALQNFCKFVNDSDIYIFSTK